MTPHRPKRTSGLAHTYLLLPATVFAVALSLTVFASHYIRESARNRDEARFKSAVEQTTKAIDLRMQTYVALLRGVGGLVVRDGGLTTHENFQSYVTALDIETNYQGVQGVGYSALVPPTLERDFLTKMSLEGFEHFRFWNLGAAHTAPELHAILYLFPEDERNLAALGLNMFSDPIRRAAMETARETGVPTATARVRLVQELDDVDPQPGFLIYVPVYIGPSDTPEARRENFVGFAYSPFRSKDLFRGILAEGIPDVAYRIYDDDKVGLDDLLYESSNFELITPGYDPALDSVVNLPTVGRSWVIRFQSTPEFDAASQGNLAGYILFAGLLISLALFTLTFLEVRARADVVKEVQERKLAQRALSISEERLRTLVDQAPLSIQVFDPEGNTTQVNRGFAQLWGVAPEETESYNVLHDPQLDQKGVLPYLRRAFNGEAVAIPAIQYVTKETIGRGNTRWVSALAYPLKDEEGKVREVVLIHQDLTEIKRVEEEIRDINASLEQRVEQRTLELARAISEMEAFSYSVAHDLRSPLRAMGGVARILIEDHLQELSPEAQGLLLRIQENSVKMGRLIDGLLDLARVSRAAIDREDVDITAEAEEIVELLQKRNPRPEAVVEIQEGLTAYADPRLIGNVLQNLLENAWKFTQNTAMPHISLGGLPAGGEDVFFVRDNGAGFEQEYSGKLFGAFERLHHESEFPGTGIGLATVRRILERHGGHAWAEGEPGKGATFYFAVPKRPYSAKDARSKREASASLGRREQAGSG